MIFLKQMCFLARRAEQGSNGVQEADVEFDSPSRERETRDLSRSRMNMWMGQVRVSSNDTSFATVHSCL